MHSLEYDIDNTRGIETENSAVQSTGAVIGPGSSCCYDAA